jgi:uncharacterized protein YoxC
MIESALAGIFVALEIRTCEGMNSDIPVITRKRKKILRKASFKKCMVDDVNNNFRNKELLEIGDQVLKITTNDKPKTINNKCVFFIPI